MCIPTYIVICIRPKTYHLSYSRDTVAMEALMDDSKVRVNYHNIHIHTYIQNILYIGINGKYLYA